MTMGELNSLQRVTPSQAAKAAYHAARSGPAGPVGRAGVSIPPSRALFRATIDGPLLRQIAGLAYAAYCSRELVEADHLAAATELHADIERRYPPADMEVLARYGLARSSEVISIGIDFPKRDERFHRINLLQPVMLPSSVGSFRMTFEGAIPLSATAPEVGEGLHGYFNKVVAVRHAKRSFDQAASFPAEFKREHGRGARWADIERAFPEIGTWLAEQREALA